MSGANDNDLLRGSLPRAIRVLAIPMVLEMTMESVFAVADVFFVGRISSDAVAIVGLTEALLTIIFAVAFGVATATTAVVARRIGENRDEEAARAAAQAIWMGITLAAIIGIIGVIFAENLLLVMGADQTLAADGAGYVRVAFGGNITIMLLFINNAAFRGAGDAKMAMWSLWLANGINLVLDPCLIFGLGPFPELGLTGAAIATVIGRGTGVLYQLVRMFAPSGRLQLCVSRMALRPRILATLGKLSIGAMLQEVVETASWVLLVRILAAFGNTAVAGYTIALRILIFALLPAWGLGNAAATLVGQNLGAKQPERAERAVWLTGAYSMAFLFVVAVVSIPLATPMIGIFSKSAAVTTIGADCLRTIAYGYVFYAWGMVIVQSFNGAGDTVTPTLMNIGTLWLFKLPAAFLLAHQFGMGPSGVFVAVTASYSLLAVVGLLLFRRGRWKTQQV